MVNDEENDGVGAVDGRGCMKRAILEYIYLSEILYYMLLNIIDQLC